VTGVAVLVISNDDKQRTTRFEKSGHAGQTGSQITQEENPQQCKNQICGAIRRIAMIDLVPWSMKKQQLGRTSGSYPLILKTARKEP
jgi:hypothetical protein